MWHKSYGLNARRFRRQIRFARKGSWQRYGVAMATPIRQFCCHLNVFIRINLLLFLHVFRKRETWMLRCSYKHECAPKSFAHRSKVPREIGVWVWYSLSAFYSDKCCEIYRATVDSIDIRINKVFKIKANRLVEPINVFVTRYETPKWIKWVGRLCDVYALLNE